MHIHITYVSFIYDGGICHISNFVTKNEHVYNSCKIFKK